MNQNLMNLLIKKLSEKYGNKIEIKVDQIKVKNVNKPYAPIIKEEVNNVLSQIGGLFHLRTGKLAWKHNNTDLIAQFFPCNELFTKNY